VFSIIVIRHLFSWELREIEHKEKQINGRMGKKKTEVMAAEVRLIKDGDLSEEVTTHNLITSASHYTLNFHLTSFVPLSLCVSPAFHT